MRTPSYTSLDDALESVALYGIELKNGNINHAPMVAETLCALGYPDAVTPWMARYRERILPRPAVSARIRPEEWRAALGERARFADWGSFFGEELQAAPWRQVLDRWMERLAPGFCAAATHGVIRVGHAVRGLADSETPPRLRELADALASWAATYQELPATGAQPKSGMTPREAIARVPIVPPGRRNNTGNITVSLAALVSFVEFAPVIGLIDTTTDLAPLVANSPKYLPGSTSRTRTTSGRRSPLSMGSPVPPHSVISPRWLATAPRALRCAMPGSRDAGFTPAMAGRPRWWRRSSRLRQTPTNSWSARLHMATSM